MFRCGVMVPGVNLSRRLVPIQAWDRGRILSPWWSVLEGPVDSKPCGAIQGHPGGGLQGWTGVGQKPAVPNLAAPVSGIETELSPRHFIPALTSWGSMSGHFSEGPSLCSALARLTFFTVTHIAMTNTQIHPPLIHIQFQKTVTPQ